LILAGSLIKLRLCRRIGSAMPVLGYGPKPDVVGVRDTKDNSSGPILAFARGVWAAFVSGIKAGNFGL
jgi:hypothetical protein